MKYAKQDNFILHSSHADPTRSQSIKFVKFSNTIHLYVGLNWLPR
jgi:hypothetical protein